MSVSPQTENGYIRIATELFEALIKVRIPGEARQMLDAIIRKTYGFQKTKDAISTSQIMEMTGLSHFGVYRARKKLKEMNLITIYKNVDSYITTYSINKVYTSWKLSTKKQTVYKNVDRVSTKMSKKCLPKQDTQKIIDNIQKTIEPSARMPREHQRVIIDKYTEIKRLNKEEVSNSYGRFVKEAKVLYDACGKSVEKSIIVIDKAVSYFEQGDKKLEWNLGTVAKRVPEILSKEEKCHQPRVY